jgi:hypothetical protein
MSIPLLAELIELVDVDAYGVEELLFDFVYDLELL